MSEIEALALEAKGILSKKVLTYVELESELHNSSVDTIDLVNFMKRKYGVKHISAGCRQVLFLRESQRLEADIKALGKYSLEAYNFIKENGGLARSREIALAIGAKRSEALRGGLENLVSSGYVRSEKAGDRRDGDIYYIEATKDQIRLAKMSTRSQEAYRIVSESKAPIRSMDLAKKMRVSIFNAGEIAKRLVGKGMIFQASLDGNPERKSMARAYFYPDKSMEGVAKVMSISPQYGLKLYGALGSRPLDTSYICKRTGVGREQAFQVLSRMVREGLVSVENGRPSKWYLSKGGPKIDVKKYIRLA